jgi:hypothetical protein
VLLACAFLLLAATLSACGDDDEGQQASGQSGDTV